MKDIAGVRWEKKDMIKKTRLTMLLFCTLLWLPTPFHASPLQDSVEQSPAIVVKGSVIKQSAKSNALELIVYVTG
jgi:hypothetical protein